MKYRIRDSNEVVFELWGKIGTIVEVKKFDYSETREFYGRDEKVCPDEELIRFQFDTPIKDSGNVNLEGMKSLLLNEKYLEVII